ncbi:MAG: hypothetical protein M3068_07595 [Gemmatimonadota bacterium]|nr:hypothetical protein [Gemmatimonadota bacterium]
MGVAEAPRRFVRGRDPATGVVPSGRRISQRAAPGGGFDGRGGISSRLGTPIPLAEIFAARSTLADSVDRTEIEGSDPAAMRDRPRALLYLAEARSIAQFLAEKEGAEYIGLMGERLLAGQSVEAILQQARTAPKDVPALEAAWRAWLRSEERR